MMLRNRQDNNRLHTEHSAGVLPECACLSCPVNLERYPAEDTRIRFNILSLLLITALIAVSLGWAVDRANSRRKLAAIEENYQSEIVWASFSMLCRDNINFFIELEKDEESTYDLYRRSVAAQVVEGWRNHREHKNEYAVRMAHASLVTIRIKSVDEFFTLTKTSSVKKWPHLNDPADPDYISLREFVKYALENKHADQYW